MDSNLCELLVWAGQVWAPLWQCYYWFTMPKTNFYPFNKLPILWERNIYAETEPYQPAKRGSITD